MKKLIIFTDLDGTLLDDSNYSFDAALPALKLIKEKGIPLIICSSKTKKEIEHYRKCLYNLHPFISENGGGIYIPKDYFKLKLSSPGLLIEEHKQYYLIRLGAKYSDLRNALNEIRTEGFDIKGFGDMTVEEISSLTKLNLEEAEMAKEREFDEPFVFKGGKSDFLNLFRQIENRGFNHTQGHFYHMLGDSDKGKAVSILIDLYRRRDGEVASIAIGDSPNDIPMLKQADFPIVVQKNGGKYDGNIKIPGLIKAGGIGPEGWNKKVLELINTETV